MTKSMAKPKAKPNARCEVCSPTGTGKSTIHTLHLFFSTVHLITLPFQKRKPKPKVGLALPSREVQVCLGPGYIPLPHWALLLTLSFLRQRRHPEKVHQPTPGSCDKPKDLFQPGVCQDAYLLFSVILSAHPTRCGRTFSVSGCHSGIRQRLYRVALEWGPGFWGKWQRQAGGVQLSSEPDQDAQPIIPASSAWGPQSSGRVTLRDRYPVRQTA